MLLNFNPGRWPVGAPVRPYRKEADIEPKRRAGTRLALLSARASGGGGYPSETRVRRGIRIVGVDKELIEKLGRNDLCPCGSGRRFQEVLHEIRQVGR